MTVIGDGLACLVEVTAGPIRVLICDDDSALRFLVREMLSLSTAVQVVAEAGDGIEALEQLRLHRPDVVLLDLNMPRQDGMETLPLLRGEFPGTRVVVLSALDDGLVGAKVLELGADRYVQKGVDPDTLIGIVEELGFSESG
jgi:two-component system response regulator DegU